MDAVHWDGVMNAYRVTPTLVRMGRREWLTDLGWRQAHADGVRTVVDLRHPREHGRRGPEPEVDPAVPAGLGIDVVSLATEDPDDPAFARMLAETESPYMDHPSAYAAYLRAFGDRVGAAVRAVAHGDGDPAHTVVVHCAAGRDRTGLVIALGQAAAGWSPDTIVEGYVGGAAGVNRWMGNHAHPRERERTGPDWDAWLDPRVQALRTFLADLDVQSFLARAGFGPADLELLRRRFAAAGG